MRLKQHVYRMGFAFVALGAVGCSTAAYRPVITPFGDVDVDKAHELEKKATSLPLRRKYPVRVIEGSIPEGLDLTEQGSKIIIKRGFEKRYEVLGEVESKPLYGNLELTARKIYWMWDMHPDEGALDGYCKWQGPLRAITLGFWSITPFNWPCVGTRYPKEQKDARRIHLLELRRGAYAMGANLVIITSSSNLGNVYVTNTGAAFAGATQFQEYTLKGFAILDREAPKVEGR